MKYSIQELDEMRQIIAGKLLDATVSGMEARELEERTERLLHTYMQNETTVEELRAAK